MNKLEAIEVEQQTQTVIPPKKRGRKKKEDILKDVEEKNATLAEVLPSAFPSGMYPELGSDLVKLTGNKLFFAHVLRQFRRQEVDMPFIAGVSLGSTYVNFAYNPRLYWALPEKERLAVLEHEVMHVVYLDIVNAKDKYTNSEEAMLWNIAQDIRINSRIEGMHDMKSAFYNVENTSKMLGEALPSDGTDDVYYGYLKKKYEDEKKKFEEFFEKYGGMDDHGKFKDGQGKGKEGEDGKHEFGCSGEMAKEIVKNVVNKAVRTSGGIGNVSGDVALALTELNKPLVHWKQELRRFAANVKNITTRSSRKKRNRRYGLLYSGKIKFPQLTLAVIVDTSGSMSDETLKQCYSEIKCMAQSGAKITVIEADSEVKQVYDFDPKKMPKIMGRGGTAYQPGIDKAKELEVDGIIYIGDMDASDTPSDPKLPFLWCVAGNQNPPANFGKVVRILNGKEK